MELRKLVLSPKKVKSNCFIYCDGFKNDEKLYNFTDESTTVAHPTIKYLMEGITNTLNN